MKFNKTKIILSGVILGLMIMVLPTFAASLDLRPNTTTEKKENEIIYDLYIVGVTKEQPISNLTININDTSNKPNIRKVKRGDNLSNARCDGNGCYEINISESGDFKIAEITLTNDTSSQIENLILTVSATGYSSVSSPAINLKGIVTTPQTSAPRSSKAEITGLTVSTGTISPAFSESVTNYTITGIKDTINSITFNPTCENCTVTYVCKENCSLSNSKSNRVILEEGANVLRVVSDSQDGQNSKEYIFTIYRGEVEEPSAYLKDLSIKGVTLSPKFDMLLNDYTAKVDKDVKKLDINYTLEDPQATVEIKGADKLKDGENTITITVTSSDSKSKQVYTVIVTREDICDPDKEDCDKDEKVEEKKIEKKKTSKLWLIILLSVIALGIIVGTWFILFKKKKNKDKDKNKKNKKDKKKGKNKIQEMLIEPDEEENDQEEMIDLEVPEEENLDNTLENDILNNREEDDEDDMPIIKPKVKPSVDDALEDLMKTKEIEFKE